MANVETRKQRQARLDSTEALGPSGGDGKGESELQAQGTKVVLDRKKSLASRKRKLGSVLEVNQETAAIGSAAIRTVTQDGNRGRSISVPEGLSGADLTAGSTQAAMGSSVPRATHQRGSKRGAMERARNSDIKRPAENDINRGRSGREVEVVYEERKGKRKVLGHMVRKSGKAKDGDAVNYDSRAAMVDHAISQYLNQKKQKRNVLTDRKIIGDSVNVVGRFTRGFLTKGPTRSGTDGETGAVLMRKPKQFRLKRKVEGESAMAEVSPISDGKSTIEGANVIPEGETAKVPNVDITMNVSKLASSNEAAELSPEVDRRSTAALGSPPDVPALNHIPLQGEPKLPKVTEPRKNKKGSSQVHVVKERRDRLPKSKSARIISEGKSTMAECPVIPEGETAKVTNVDIAMKNSKLASSNEAAGFAPELDRRSTATLGSPPDVSALYHIPLQAEPKLPKVTEPRRNKKNSSQVHVVREGRDRLSKSKSARIISEGKSIVAEAPVNPKGETVKVPNVDIAINDSKLGSSNEAAPELDRRSTASLGSPPDVSALSHIPLQAEPKLPKVTEPRRSRKSSSQVHVVKESRDRLSKSKSVRIISEGKATIAEAPVNPEGETAKVPNVDIAINDSKLASSNEVVEFAPELDRRSTAALGTPPDVSALNHIPLQAEPKLPKVTEPRRNRKSSSQVHVVKESRDRLSKSKSARIISDRKSTVAEAPEIPEGETAMVPHVDIAINDSKLASSNEAAEFAPELDRRSTATLGTPPDVSALNHIPLQAVPKLPTGTKPQKNKKGSSQVHVVKAIRESLRKSKSAQIISEGKSIVEEAPEIPEGETAKVPNVDIAINNSKLASSNEVAELAPELGSPPDVSALNHIPLQAVPKLPTGTKPQRNKKSSSRVHVIKASRESLRKSKPARIISVGKSTIAEAPVIPDEETAKVPNVDIAINNYKLGSSNEAAPELDRRSTASPGSPPGVSALNHIILDVDPKLPKVTEPRKNKESSSQVHVVKESRDRLPKFTYARITRAMKTAGFGPTGSADASPALPQDPKPGSSIDEPADQVALPMSVDQTTVPITGDPTAVPTTVDRTVVPMTAAETASMQLRNHKKVSGATNLNAAERPRKRVKKEHDKPPRDTFHKDMDVTKTSDRPPADTFQEDVDVVKTSDSVLENRTANSIEGLGAIDETTSDSQVNGTKPERNGNSALVRQKHSTAGRQLSSAEGVHTRRSKIAGALGSEPQIEPGSLPLVSGHLMKPIKGRVQKTNDEKDSSQTKECTEGNGRKGGGLGRLKKRGKKKLDPGGLLYSEGHLEKSSVDSVLDEKASEPSRNGLQEEETDQCNRVKESGNVGPGPSSEVQTELGKQKIDVQSGQGITSGAIGKGLNPPVEPAETMDKTGVQKSTQRAETDGVSERGDHDHLARKDGRAEIVAVEREKLEAKMHREAASQITGVLTRRSKVDGKYTGLPNGSVSGRYYSGTWKKGRKKVGLGGFVKNSKNRVDSTHGKDSEPGSNELQDKQAHHCTQVEVSSHVGLGPLGEDREDEQVVGAETASGRLEQPSELHNVGREQKIGVENAVKLVERGAAGEQIDAHDQVMRKMLDDGEDSGLKHSETDFLKELPVRTAVSRLRGRKLDGQSRIDAQMEPQRLVSGHSDKLGEGRRKKKTGVGKVNGSVSQDIERVQTRSHLGRLKNGGTIIPVLRGLSTNSEGQVEKDEVAAVRENMTSKAGQSGLQGEDGLGPAEDSILVSPQANKSQMELREQRIEVETLEAAGTVEKPTELQGEGDGEEKGIELPQKLAEKAGGSQENDHHDRALEKLMVETQDLDGKNNEKVNVRKNPAKKTGRRDFLRAREEVTPVKDTSLPTGMKSSLRTHGEVMPVKDTSLLKSAMRPTRLEKEEAPEDAGKRMLEMPGKRKRKEQGIRTQDSPEVVGNVRPVSVDVTNKIPEFSDKTSAGSKGHRGSQNIVETVIATDLQPSMENTDLGLPIQEVPRPKLAEKTSAGSKVREGRKRVAKTVITDDLQPSLEKTGLGLPIEVRGVPSPKVTDKTSAGSKGSESRKRIVATMIAADMQPSKENTCLGLPIEEVPRPKLAEKTSAGSKVREGRKRITNTLITADLQPALEIPDLRLPIEGGNVPSQKLAEKTSAGNKGWEGRKRIVKTAIAADVQPSLETTDLGLPNEVGDVSSRKLAEKTSAGSESREGRKRVVTTVIAADVEPSLETTDLGLPIEVEDVPSPRLAEKTSAESKGREGRKRVVQTAIAADVQPSLENPDFGLPIEVGDITTVKLAEKTSAGSRGREGRRRVVTRLTAADLQPSLENPVLGLPIDVGEVPSPKLAEKTSAESKGREGRRRTVKTVIATDLQPSVENPDLGLPIEVGDISNPKLADKTPAGSRGREGRKKVLKTVIATDLQPSLDNTDAGLLIEVVDGQSPELAERTAAGSEVQEGRKRKRRIKTMIAAELQPSLENPDLGLPIEVGDVPSQELAERTSAGNKGRELRKRIIKTVIAADLQPSLENTVLGLAIEVGDIPHQKLAEKTSDGSEGPEGTEGRKRTSKMVIADLQPSLEETDVGAPIKVGDVRNPKLAENSSIGSKRREGMKRLIKTVTTADFRPPLENTDPGLPIEDGGLAKEPPEGISCNGDHEGQEKLSEEVQVPERRKVDGPRNVKSASMDTAGKSRVVPEVVRVSENDLPLSSGEGVDAGVVQSEGLVQHGCHLFDIVVIALEAPQIGLPIEENAHEASDQEGLQKLSQGLPSGGSTSKAIPEEVNLKDSCHEDRLSTHTTQSDHKASDQEGLQKLSHGLPAGGSTSKAIPEDVNLKDSCLEDGLATDTTQVDPVEGRAETVNSSVEVTQNAPHVEGELTFQASGPQGGIASGQGPLKTKKWKKKYYHLGVDFQRVTRGKNVSNIESQGVKNGKVAEAATREHVEISAKGVTSIAENGRDSAHLEEVDVEKEGLKQGEKSADVPNSLDECATEPISVALRNEPKESLDHNPGQNACMAVEVTSDVVESCQAPHVNERQPGPKSDVAVMATEQETDVEVIEVQKSRVPGSPGKHVCAVEEGKKGDEPTSNTSSLLNQLDEMKTPVQEIFNGQQHDQPAPSLESLLSDQQKNDVLSKQLDSRDGPFALEDGISLKLHCGQENASSPIDGGQNSEVSHSPYLANICGQDLNHFITAHRPDSISTLDRSECLTMIETSDPAATIVESDSVAPMVESDPVTSMVESDPVASMVLSDPVASVVQSEPVASQVESEPVITVVESDPVASIVEFHHEVSTVESDPAAFIVESDLAASTVESDPVASSVEPDPATSAVESDTAASRVESDPSASRVESDPSASSVESDPPASLVESDPAAFIVELDPVASSVESDPATSVVESDPAASRVESDPSASSVESDPPASLVESDPAAFIVELDPVASSVESDPATSVVESDPAASRVESDPSASIVESDPPASLVESDPAAFIVEADPAASRIESDPGASRVESDPAASRVESDPVVSMVESDPVASTVESGLDATLVESSPLTTVVESGPVPSIVESDPITIAEGLSPMICTDMPNCITTASTLESITVVGKLECDTTVTGSDSVPTVDTSTSVAVTDKAASVAGVGNCSVLLAVVNAEITTEVCEINSVRESTVSPTENGTDGGESLITEALNSKQVAVEVPLEDFGFKDAISTKSPILQRASPAEDAIERMTGNGDVSGVTLENQRMQQEKSTAETPGGKVTEASCLQHEFNDQTSSQEGYQAVTTSQEDLHQQLLTGNDNGSPAATDGFSTLQKILERDDLEQKSQDKADSVQQGQPAPVEDSVRRSFSDVEDSLQEASIPSEPSISPEGGVFVEHVPSEHPQLEVTDQKCTVESPDVIGLGQSGADGIPQEGLRGALEDHGYASTEQVVGSCSPLSIAVAMETKDANNDSPISSVEDALVDNDPYQEKLSSGLEQLSQPESEGKEPDEPVLKTCDVECEDRIEVNTEVQEVEAGGIHSEAKQGHSKAGEVATEMEGFDADGKEVHLNKEEVSLGMKMTQDVQAEVQQVQAEVEKVQVEVLETQVEVQMLDGADDSLNRAAEFVKVDTEGKEVDTGAKELQSELEEHTEVHSELETELKGDVEAKDPVVDLVTETNVQKERVLELDNLETMSSQQPQASNLKSPVSDGVLAISVPEEDISRPFGSDIPLDFQAEAVYQFSHSGSIPLETGTDIQLAEQVLQDAGLSEQLTSPVEAGRCLEGDVLQPDIQMELHEKEDPKSNTLRSEDPVSQRNMVKGGSLVSKKRKARIGSEGGDREENPPARVFSQKKGFLLASTSIEAGSMRIRPRPLDPDQSMPVLVEGRDKDFYEYDGGSFYRWVQQQEEARFRRPVVDPAADGVSEGAGLSTVSQSYLVKRRPIFIPLFRNLPDDDLQTNSRIVRRPEQHVVESSFPRPQAYLRYTKSAARTLGHVLGCSFSTVPSVYDMDDEDEEWLQQYNENLGQSEQDQLVSDDTFEQLIELFEREFYRISLINNSSAGLPRNLGDKGGASGNRGERLDAESSQRNSRMEGNRDGARLSRPLELFEGTVSHKEIERSVALQNGSDDCCICNGGENSDFDPVRKCQICSINVHQSCYGICETEADEFGDHSENPNWCCRKCEAVVGGRALPSISCAICCKSGGAMKPTVDPLKWAHVACALYTNETFFVDAEAMEPVDGLAAVEARVKKQPQRCGLCGARDGSCVRCTTRGCRAPFHISCGVSQGASFELRHMKQLVVGVRSYCPRHASFVPGAGDPVEPLPAVSTESSDTLEMRHIEQKKTGEKSSGTEDAVMNGAAWQGSFPDNTNLDRSELKRYVRKKRSGARPRVTPSKQDATSGLHEVREKELHGVAKTSPRSTLKENVHIVSQYMDETDPYSHPPTEEKLQSEAVSAATSGSSSHLALTSENVDHTGKVTSTGDEIDLTHSVAKDKSVTGDADTTSSQAEKAVTVAVSLKLPSLQTLDTKLATPQIVKAVYSFWQSKRVKAKGPILHELRQLHVARSRGIFNKIVHRNTELLPAVGHDSLARIPVTRRPRSLATRDPVASRFSEVRQQLNTLRSIAGKVVRREQLKLEDQKLLYESAQQRLLIAREIPGGRRCHWCENTKSLLRCSSCPKAFCFQCFKHKRGYGVKGWIAASRQEKYVCNCCFVSTAHEKSLPDLGTNLSPSEPRSTSVSQVAMVSDRLGDWNHGSDETAWKGDPPSNPHAGSSSTQDPASTFVPGRGKMMCNGQSADGQTEHTEFAVPSIIERDRAVNRAYHEGILSSDPNDPDGEESRVQAGHRHGEEGKKVAKRRRAKVLKKQAETVLRTTKRIRKLARSSSFVYGSEDESDESRTDKKTVKLSDLRDKGAKGQCTNLLEAGAEGNVTEKAHPPLKFGIRFSSGKLILTRHGPPQLP